MTNSLMVVHANCPAGEEQAFNRWYDDIHVPDVLSIPGMLAARRFRLHGPGPVQQILPLDGQSVSAGAAVVFRYLCLYELEPGADPDRVKQAILAARQGWLARSRLYPGMEAATAFYTPLG